MPDVIPSPPAETPKNPPQDDGKATNGKPHWTNYAAVWAAAAAAIAAACAAGFGGWQAWIASDTEQRQLRAYVIGGAQGSVDNFTLDGRAHVKGLFENLGQTPVYNAVARVGVGVLDYPPPKGQRDYPSCASIMAGPDVERIFFGKATYPEKDRDTGFTSNEINKIKGGTAAIYFFGRICYTDIFKKTRHSEFCVFWNWKNNALITSANYCPHGNTADDPE